MTTPNGPIKLSDIQTEFGGTNPISLSEYYRGGANVPSGTATSPIDGVPISTSGTIRMGMFRGVAKTVNINLTISSNIDKYNIRTAAGNPSSPANVTLTINSGISVYSWSGTIPADPALDTGTGWPVGTTINIINNGLIIGAAGSSQPTTTSPGNGFTGYPGGHALKLQYPTNITNNGIITGGGGGGGSGASYGGSGGPFGGYGGDGSGGLFGMSGQSYQTAIAGQQGGGPGGTGGAAPTSSGNYGATGKNGTAVSTAAGTQGAGGGGGGALGAPGGAGGNAVRTSPANTYTGGIAGRAGSYVIGSSNATWVATGTRIGLIDDGNISGIGGTVTAASSGSFAAAVTLAFNTDGTIVATNGGNGALVTIGASIGAQTGASWYRPNTAGIGSSYWIRATLVSGSAFTTGTMNTWTQITANQTWGYGPLAAPGNLTGVILIEISSNSSGTAIVTSGRYSMAAVRT